MSGAEAITAVELISACIDVTKTIIDFARAVQDDQGLPSRLRDLFEKLPVVADLLEEAQERCDTDAITEEARQNAIPVLKQCQNALGELKEILRKACPKDGDSRSKRVWKGVRTVFLGRESRVQKLLDTILENLRLLEQKQLYDIGDKLDELQHLTEALGHEEDGKYRHSGAGNIFAFEGGTNTNYVQGGSHNRCINTPGTYNEQPIYHLPPERNETPPLPTDYIPYPSDPNFIERPALTNRIDALLKVPGARAALAGFGGVGKTQLAIEFARAVRRASSQTWVLWLHASSASNFEQSVRRLVELLKLRGRKSPGADVFLLLESWLRDASKGRWLMVIDNADNVDFLHGPIDKAGQELSTARRRLDYIPECDHGSVLFTSRYRDQARELVFEANIIDVRPMDETEAKAMLDRKLRLQSSNLSSGQLGRALDCIPLAISQAAAYIQERGQHYTVDRYCMELEESRTSRTILLQKHVALPDRDVEASNAIMLTWQISFEYLLATRRTAADLLGLMSFCDREAIPEVLIRPRTGNAESSVSSTFDDDMVTLCNFSFVSETTREGTWEMHRLVQDATRAWLKHHERLDEMLSRFVQRMVVTFPDDIDDEWALYRVLLPHVMSLSECTPSDKATALQWAAIMFKASQYAVKYENYEVSLRIGQLSFEVFSKHLPSTDINVQNSKVLVVMGLVLQGQLEKAERLESTFMERTKMLGVESHPPVQSMCSLISIYERQGRKEEADQLAAQLVETIKKMLEKEHLAMLPEACYLIAHFIKKRRWEEAEELRTLTFGLLKKMCGECHVLTLHSMSLVSQSYLNQKQYKDVEELLSKATETWRRVLGLEKPRVLRCMTLLAQAYEGQGRFEEAEELISTVLEKSRILLGDEHPETEGSIHILTELYAKQEKWSNAEQLQMEAMQRSTAPDRIASRRYLDNLVWLNYIYVKQGKNPEDLRYRTLDLLKANATP